MLAPRKKLWSTPPSAVDAALDLARLDADDVVFDVGCGDGRVLVQMAARSVPLSTQLDAASADVASSEGDGSGGDGQQQHPADAASKPQYHHCHRFVGIEISPERADEARGNIARARSEGKIPSHVSIEIITGGPRSTVVFLYLVPRGLRLIKDVVWPPAKAGVTKDPSAEFSEATASDTTASDTSNAKDRELKARKRPRRIITYMAPFENTKHVRKELCKVEHQEGAAWPVYLYHANV